MIEQMWDMQAGGRHALDEDAFQTPIFHALARGGRRRNQQEGVTASVEEFRRDPLTAPIPIQALATTPAWHEPSARERSGSAHRERSGSAHRDRSGSARETAQREPSAAASRGLGLTVRAERGRHRLAPTGSHW